MTGKSNRLLNVPKLHQWLQTNPDGKIDVERTNTFLREEFENIGIGMNEQNDQVAAVVKVVGTTPGGGGTKPVTPVTPTPTTDTDELVKVSRIDRAGYLEDKIRTDGSITREIYPSVNGQVIVLSLNNPVLQFHIPFEGREVTIMHPIGHEFYSVQVDKPMKDGGNVPLPYETYRKYANRLWIRFAADEYGYVIITGASAIYGG